MLLDNASPELSCNPESTTITDGKATLFNATEESPELEVNEFGSCCIVMEQLLNWSKPLERIEKSERRRDMELARQNISRSCSMSWLPKHSNQASAETESEGDSKPSIFHWHRCPSSLCMVRFELMDMVDFKLDSEVEMKVDLIRIRFILGWLLASSIACSSDLTINDSLSLSLAELGSTIIVSRSSVSSEGVFAIFNVGLTVVESTPSLATGFFLDGSDGLSGFPNIAVLLLVAVSESDSDKGVAI